jgi:FkbM family methyltransferase
MRKLSLFLKYFIELGILNFLDYLLQRFIKRNKIIFIKVPDLSYKVSIRNNPYDIQIFTQIFIYKEYNIIIEEVNTIIDCGANIGLASLYFLSKFPDARIIAVEPEENNFKMLQDNLSNYKNVICIKKGIWGKVANLEISNYNGGNAGFITKESITSERAISSISIDQIIQEYQLTEIDILKIDIEGSEEQIFLTEPKWIKIVRMIFCEIHENMKPGLTARIESMLIPYFDVSMNGEYHVFKRKSALSEQNIRIEF